MIDAALLWVIVGGFLEPVWVVGLKKYNDTRNLAWGAFAVVFMIVSPCCLAFAMELKQRGMADFGLEFGRTDKLEDILLKVVNREGIYSDKYDSPLCGHRAAKTA